MLSGPGWRPAPDASSVRIRQLFSDLELLALIGELRPPPAPARPRAPAIARTIRPLGPGTTWNHLQILGFLGGGSFARVYRAWDPYRKQEVALKIPYAHGRATSASDILTEARHLARLRHPHVVVVHGAEIRDGRVGMWMELVRGTSLDRVLARRGPLRPARAVSIGRDLCRAMAAVHAAGLVHRDIKPQNVMVEHGGRTVLVDFGVSLPTERWRRSLRRLTGTPLYLAPEVLAGGSATRASDIYSLGVLLFHLVTGEYPVVAPTVDALLRAHHRRDVRRLNHIAPSLPAALAQVIDRATAFDPLQRFPNAGLMGSALARVNYRPHAQS